MEAECLPAEGDGTGVRQLNVVNRRDLQGCRRGGTFARWRCSEGRWRLQSGCTLARYLA